MTASAPCPIWAGCPGWAGCSAIAADPKTELEVNLPDQTITLLSSGESEKFDISSYKKDNMINGFDDIDYLQNIKGEIQEFASNLPL